MPKKDLATAPPPSLDADPPAGGRWIRLPDGSVEPAPEDVSLPVADVAAAPPMA